MSTRSRRRIGEQGKRENNSNAGSKRVGICPRKQGRKEIAATEVEYVRLIKIGPTNDQRNESAEERLEKRGQILVIG